MAVSCPSRGTDPAPEPRSCARTTPATECASEEGRSDLAVLLARERLAHALPVGLRQLAREFAYGALSTLFPHFIDPDRAGSDVDAQLQTLAVLLTQALATPGNTQADEPSRAAAAGDVLGRLGAIREALLLDAQAIFDGDPAARSVDEVIVAYPGFLAIAIHRVAHELHDRAPLFARLLAEVAHSATGIDIHPGAHIGPSFAIDHGTGIVIGETAALGARVRLYQGVTLGAARVTKRLEGVKRHPTIGDDVVIYANATILGGDTAIGHGSRIGGNVWLTRSVPPYSVVTPTARVERRVGDSSPADDLIEFNI